MDVTAIIRGDNKSAAPRAIAKDLFDLTGKDLNGFDVVVDVPPPSLKQQCLSLMDMEKHLRNS